MMRPLTLIPAAPVAALILAIEAALNAIEKRNRKA